jgi:hypothetical protein
VRKSGASFACAIASGITALLLEFSKQPPLNFTAETPDNLRELAMMRKVLLAISRMKNVAEFHFLYPWRILCGSKNEPDGGDVTPHSPRWDAAYEIAKIVDKDFGSHTGKLWVAKYEKIRAQTQPS